MARFKFFRSVFKLHPIKESFQFALRGVIYLFIFHRNMRIIFLSGIAVFLFGIYLKLPRIEFAVLCVTISVVFLAEMFNSAIELIIDMFTDKYHTMIKIIKDISAGVVLLASLNAVAVGYFLFSRRILELFR